METDLDTSGNPLPTAEYALERARAAGMQDLMIVGRSPRGGSYICTCQVNRNKSAIAMLNDAAEYLASLNQHPE